MSAGWALLLAPAGSAQAPFRPANSITLRGALRDQNFPDPFVLRSGTEFFAFATNAQAPARTNVQVAKSHDLSHWAVLPDALPNLPSWAVRGHTWAPEVLARSPHQFVMYYTVRDAKSGFQCVSRALARNPAGPYIDSSRSALVCQTQGAEAFCGSIDPSPFVDTDGQPYLIWKSDENAAPCSKPPRLWSAPLSADGLSLAGAARELLVMDQPWQVPIVEGPAMTRVEGKYYLLYSANRYQTGSYAMGYASCQSPLGPCQNESTSGPAIASTDTAFGPGGGSFFEVDGEPWLAYHAWRAPNSSYANGGARVLHLDRLSFEGGVVSLKAAATPAEIAHVDEASADAPGASAALAPTAAAAHSSPTLEPNAAAPPEPAPPNAATNAVGK